MSHIATPRAIACAPQLGDGSQGLILKVQGTEHHGRTIRLSATKCTVGSAPGCTLRLRAPGVQPLHCWILTGPRGTVVRRRSAGTFLNGGAFIDAPLAPGDRLQVGPIELEVTSCKVAPAEAFDLPPPAEVPASATQRELEALQFQLRETQEQASVRLAAAKEQADRLEVERDGFAQRLREAEQQLIELTSQWSAAEGRATLVGSQLTLQIAEQDQSRLAHDSERNQALKEIERLKSELSRVQHEASARLSEAVQAAERSTGERDTLAAQLRQLQEQSTGERIRAEAASIAAVQRLALASAEIAELQLRLGEFEAQRADAVAAAAASAERDRKIAELEGLLAASRTEFSSAQTQLNEVSQSLERDRGDWQQEKDRLAASLREAQEQLALQATEIEQLRSQPLPEATPAPVQTLVMPAERDLAAESAALADRSAELAEARRALETQQAEWQAQQAQWQAQQAEWQARHAQWQAQQDQQATELAERAAELNGRQEELEQLKLQVDARQEELRKQLEDLRSQQYAFDRERMAAAEELARIEQSAASRQAEVDRLASELEAERQAWHRERAQWQSEHSQQAPSPQSGAATLVGVSLDENRQCISDAIIHNAPSTSTSNPNDTGDVPSAQESPVGWSNPASDPKPVWPQTQPAAQTDDESIESYMERLMQRVRGGDSTSTSSAASKPSYSVMEVAPEPPAEAAEPPTNPAVTAGPVQPEAFVPRTAAPEQGANLAAMREVANTAARTAIETHTQRRNTQLALAKAIGLAITFVLSLLLMYCALCQGIWLAAGGAFAGFVIATLWTIQALRHLKGVGSRQADPNSPAGAAIAVDRSAEESA